MSFLGSPDESRNPNGWYLFSIAVIFKMITDVPLMLYVFRHVTTFAVIGGYFALFLYIISLISGIIVGLFPDTEKKRKTGGNFFKDLRLGMVHNIAAVISFGVSMLANLVVGLSYIAHPTARHIGMWLPPLFIYVAAATGMAWTQIQWQKKLKSDKTLKPWPGKGIYSLPLWEWILFFSLQVFIYWNVFII
jgi:hypothetical protein